MNGTFVAAFVLVVAVLNLLPIAWELIVSMLISRGYKMNITRLVHIAKFMNKFGFFAEYALAFVVLGLILGAMHLHFDIYYPFFQAEGSVSWMGFVVYHLLPSAFLNSNMLFNFYKVIFTSPGYPDETHVEEDLLKSVSGKSSTGIDGATKHCKFCKKPKPRRAHHCSTCGKCVLRMDHHCPFAANCIGKNNYHNFFLFIFYSFLSSLYAVAIGFRPHYVCHYTAENDFLTGVKALCDQMESTFHVMFWVSVFVCIVLTALWVLMFFMAIRGLTMNEWLNVYVWKSRNSQDYKYDLGSVRRNLEASFGPMRMWWRWLIPSFGLKCFVTDDIALVNTYG